jgi:hypothetical protein
MSETHIPAGVPTAVFDKKNHNWSNTAGLNRMFIQAQLQWANNLLASRGYLPLNEVLHMLGMEQTEEGALVGWVDAPSFEVDFGEDADAPLHGKPIPLVFNTNSTNVFRDKK